MAYNNIAYEKRTWRFFFSPLPTRSFRTDPAPLLLPFRHTDTTRYIYRMLIESFFALLSHPRMSRASRPCRAGSFTAARARVYCAAVYNIIIYTRLRFETRHYVLCASS